MLYSLLLLLTSAVLSGFLSQFPVYSWITFKLADLMYKVLTTDDCGYLHRVLHSHTLCCALHSTNQLLFVQLLYSPLSHLSLALLKLGCKSWDGWGQLPVLMFSKTVHLSNRVLNALLPPPSVVSQHYRLSHRTPSLQLPEHSTHLSDYNFVNACCIQTDIRLGYFVVLIAILRSSYSIFIHTLICVLKCFSLNEYWLIDIWRLKC